MDHPESYASDGVVFLHIRAAHLRSSVLQTTSRLLPQTPQGNIHILHIRYSSAELRIVHAAAQTLIVTKWICPKTTASELERKLKSPQTLNTSTCYVPQVTETREHTSRRAKIWQKRRALKSDHTAYLPASPPTKKYVGRWRR